ncbi:hypothetical protein [Streptomyces botrytidirepellens]|uniref:Uncharacterized protein n=1 Tax=Streptomyces botrytidirepellens TaxID=2486417 RepID=A0A3M8WWH4_9ACTN|nr:hypothetical protein [Streptomyces botrytidirepellens]RNG34528.1 hypothetical protein EEJ42_05165 [Streptomyces botrytidirepellens]
MVDGEELERLRAEAASREYAPMARLARALYENGLPAEHVLHKCYGVGFPREFFVIADADPYGTDLLAMWTNQPWQMAVPLDRGGPAARSDTLEPMERRFHDMDSDLLPLLYLVRPGIDTEDHGVVLCYRLTELAAGRPTIFGARRETTSLDEVARRGDSLLAVLRAHHAGYLHELDEELENWEGKGEYDTVDEDEVEEVRALVDRIETFQREAGA